MEWSGVALSEEERTRIRLLRNIRYHEDRQAFLSFINNLMNLLIVLSGTAVVATLTTGNDLWTKIAAVVPAILGAIQLVFDWSRRQFLHESLRTRFTALLAKLRADNVPEIGEQIDDLYVEEPPTFHALDALAYNAAMRARRRPSGKMLIVTRRQRTLANMVRFTDTVFPRVENGGAGKDPAPPKG